MIHRETRTYRATLDAWLGQLLLPLVFFCVLAYTGVNLAGLNPWLAGLGLGLIAAVAVLDHLVPMLRNWLHLDARSIEGSFNGQCFMVYWTEVLAAWLVLRQRQKYLCLGTREGTLVIPLRFFDDQHVWKRVQHSVPPAALEPCAIQRLPDYRQLARAGESAARRALEEAADPNAEARTVADHWLFQMIGWSGLTFFLFGAVSAASSDQYLPVVIFLLLAGFSGFLLMHWGITELSVTGVTRHTLFSHSEIRWDDVRWIEIDPSDSVIVLVGEDSQLSIPGPALWSGVGKKSALAMLLAQAERRKIPLRRTMGAVFKPSRKSRSRH